jgi:hypothetical protein
MNTTNNDWGFFIDIENPEHYYDDHDIDKLIIYEYVNQKPYPKPYLNVSLIVFKVTTTIVATSCISYFVFYIL